MRIVRYKKQSTSLPYQVIRDIEVSDALALVETYTTARKSITSVGWLLIGIALMISLPWDSTLAAEKDTDTKANTSVKAPTPSAAVSKAVASTKDRLKNWPGFLGPKSGHAEAKGLSIDWNGETGEGIKWKTKVPLPGFNSPIIWGDKIFLSGADENTREVYCFDTETGKILWKKAVANVPGSPSSEDSPEVSDDTGFAAATMATDGLRVFAIFSNGDLVAFDFEGNQVWAKNLGIPENPYGYSSSLVIYENSLLIQYDIDENSFFTGLDVATGKERWRTPRDFGPSWSSPIVIDTGKRDEVILAADPMVVSYNPKNGKELWRVECLEGGEIAPTPVYANGLIYVAADYVKVAAIDVIKHEVVWETQDMIPGIATPLVVGEYLIGGLSEGGMVCYNAKTGEEIWVEDSDEGFYASPILANGLVYIADRSGIMHIFRPDAEYKSISTPALGEEIVSTAAAMGDTLYIRGINNLYRIGK